MHDLDKKDLSILYELDKNSRQTISQIAKKTLSSCDVTRYRIQQLEKKGFIQGYIAVLDLSKFGFTLNRIYLKLQNTTKEIEKRMIKFIADLDTTIIVYQTDGEFDIAIGILTREFSECQQAYEKILTEFRKYIIDKHYSLFLDYPQYYKNYLVDEKQRDYTELSTYSHTTYKYRATDIQILKEISTNARISLVKLSQKLNMPLNTVKYHLKNLERNKVIISYRALINYRKLGYEYYKIDLVLEDISTIPSLKEYITRHPNIIYRDVAVGGSDFEFDCELSSQEEFYKLIEDIKEKFPIRSYFYIKVREISKHSYFPKKLEQLAIKTSAQNL